MKKYFFLSIFFLLGSFGFAAETPAPVVVADPVALSKLKTDQDLREDVTKYILDHSTDGIFSIQDTKAAIERKLRFIRLHHKIGKLADSYYVCVDFRDTATNELVDVDIEFVHEDQAIKILNTLIHKVDGLRRYNDFKYMRKPTLNTIPPVIK